MGDRAGEGCAVRRASPRSPRRSATVAAPSWSTCSPRASVTSTSSPPRSARASPTRRSTSGPSPRAGLVTTRRDGTRIYYRLASDRVGELWAALRDVAAAHHERLDELAAAYLGDRDRLEQIGRDELAQRLDAGDVVVLDVRPERRVRRRAHRRRPLDPDRRARRQHQGPARRTSRSSPTAAARTACSPTTPSVSCAAAAARPAVSKTASPNGDAPTCRSTSPPRRNRARCWLEAERSAAC